MIVKKIFSRIKKADLVKSYGISYFVRIKFINYEKNIVYLDEHINISNGKERFFYIFDINKKEILCKYQIDIDYSLSLSSSLTYYVKIDNKLFFTFTAFGDNEGFKDTIYIEEKDNKMYVNKFDLTDFKYISIVENSPNNTITYYDKYSFDENVMLFNTETKEKTFLFKLGRNDEKDIPWVEYSNLTYSPCYKYILACDPLFLYVWEVKTGLLLKRLTFDSTTEEEFNYKHWYIEKIQYSHNGKYLLLPCDYYGTHEGGALCYVLDSETFEVKYRLGDKYFNSEFSDSEDLTYSTGYGGMNAIIDCEDKYVFLETYAFGVIIFDLETGEIKGKIESEKYQKIFLDPKNPNRFKGFIDDEFIEGEYEI